MVQPEDWIVGGRHSAAHIPDAAGQRRIGVKTANNHMNRAMRREIEIIMKGGETWVCQKPVKDIYILIGQIATVYYFLFFVVLIPVVGLIETKLAHYKIK